MANPFVGLNPAADALKKGIEKFLYTHPAWKGTALDTAAFGQPTEEERLFVNNQGAIHGCHTCLTNLHTDTNQPWIGDHIPPTRLSDAVKRAYGLANEQVRLLPSCSECSSLQSALINRLNKEQSNGHLTPFEALDEDEQLMLIGGYTSQGELRSRTAKVNKTQGLVVQKNGSVDGCHICQGNIPQQVYHADHCPPQEFGTSYMPKVCAALGVTLPAKTVLRPQCPRCSGAQGGDLAHVVTQAILAAQQLGITVYK
jgi:hypothetical protein